MDMPRMRIFPRLRLTPIPRFQGARQTEMYSCFCLRCASPLKKGNALVKECQRCGLLNTVGMRNVYWTKNRTLCVLETIAKTLIVTALVAAVVGIAVFREERFGFESAAFVGLAVLLGSLLWLTASRMTRHVRMFPAALIWTILFFLLGFFTSASDVPPPYVIALFSLSLVSAIVGFVFSGIRRRLESRYRDFDPLP